MDEKYVFSEYSYPNRLQMVTQLTFFELSTKNLENPKTSWQHSKGFLRLYSCKYRQYTIKVYMFFKKKNREKYLQQWHSKNTLYIL